MHPQQAVVLVSFCGAVVFGLSAIRFRQRRWTTALPALILMSTAIYELAMDRWEKTVTAPIRLDLLVEIPLMIAVLGAGAIAMILQLRRQPRPSN